MASQDTHSQRRDLRSPVAIHQAMTAAGCGVRELGRLVHTSQTTIHGLRNGDRQSVPADLADRIEKILGQTAGSLFGPARPAGRRPATLDQLAS